MRISGKKKAVGNATIQQEELARRIAKYILSTQAHLASYLNAKTNQLRPKEKLILFIAFIILCTAINIYILI